ncbi:MAG TPA: DNA-deoxyinosine glycosylase [Bacteroidia bacterium]|jgi:hypoxanthine-DNA glycosylase|nr:DNA-deoxyinosine glycosylase [Bacteroidia bacterium]
MKTAFAPIESKDSTVLILGTMPGERSIEINQYYGHNGNQFWKLMFDIFNQPFTDNYTDRIALLTKNKIALWDVLSHCEREGSADSKIKNAIPNNFKLFYKKHSNIKHVFFASKEAEKLYKKHVGQFDELIHHVLPSPSGAHASKTYTAKLIEWKEILRVL